jgi:hypothetical protein
MQCLWCWISANTQAITATAAVFGALFTALYLFATILIFLQTKKSADAAAKAARAATDSANLTAQLYRPHMGLETASLTSVQLVPGAYLYEIDWTFRNFGTVPASHVRLLVECSTDCEGKTSSIRTETEPGDVEVFPDTDRLTGKTSLHLDAQQFDDLNPRRGTISAVATVHYSTPTGATYKHTVHVRLDALGKVTFTGSKTELA